MTPALDMALPDVAVAEAGQVQRAVDAPDAWAVASTGALAGIAARLTALEQRLGGMERTLREVRQLVGPFAVPIGPDELLVQTIHSMKYLVPARDTVMTPQLVVYRQWEAELSALLPTLCPSGSVFVDVGANFGYFTCLVAARMGSTPGSRVIAVEPNPEMLRLLQTNVAINWSMAPVRVTAAAAAAEPGERILHVPAERAANGSLAAAASGGGSLREVAVQAVRLDDLLRDETRVDLLKVDVEGFEPEVFRGASETLARPGLRVVFEWSQRQLRQAGFDPMEVPAMLGALGYRLFDAETYRAKGESAALDIETLATCPYLNILALR